MYAFICLIFEEEYIKIAFSMRYSYNVRVFQLLGPLTLAQLLLCFVSYHMFLLLALLLRTGLWRFIVAGRCPFALPATISRVVLSAVGLSEVHVVSRLRPCVCLMTFGLLVRGGERLWGTRWFFFRASTAVLSFHVLGASRGPGHINSFLP